MRARSRPSSCLSMTGRAFALLVRCLCTASPLPLHCSSAAFALLVSCLCAACQLHLHCCLCTAAFAPLPLHCSSAAFALLCHCISMLCHCLPVLSHCLSVLGAVPFSDLSVPHSTLSLPSIDLSTVIHWHTWLSSLCLSMIFHRLPLPSVDIPLPSIGIPLPLTGHCRSLTRCSVHDSSKRFIGASDAWPEGIKLSKGTYTVVLQLRHEDTALLSQFVGMPIAADSSLSKTVALGDCSRRRDCHFAAPPSTFSWCTNSDGRESVSRMTVSVTAQAASTTSPTRSPTAARFRRPPGSHTASACRSGSRSEEKHCFVEQVGPCFLGVLLSHTPLSTVLLTAVH